VPIITGKPYRTYRLTPWRLDPGALGVGGSGRSTEEWLNSATSDLLVESMFTDIGRSGDSSVTHQRANVTNMLSKKALVNKLDMIGRGKVHFTV